MAVDHVGFLKSTFLEHYKEFLGWALISYSGLGSQTTQLPSGFACSYGWVSQILEVPKMSWGSFLAISQESNLHSLPGKTVMNYITKQGFWPFLKWAFKALKFNHNCLGFLVTYRVRAWLNHDVPDKDLVNKPQLDTGSMLSGMKQSHFYCVYKNKNIAMGKIILIKSF